MADSDGDLELDITEWLTFSAKLAAMPEAAFMKSFTAYKSALKNRAEGNIRSQNDLRSVKVKEEVKRINAKTKAEVIESKLQRLAATSIDPSQKNRETKKSTGRSSGSRTTLVKPDDQQVCIAKCLLSPVCVVDSFSLIVDMGASCFQGEESVQKVSSGKVRRSKKSRPDAVCAAQQLLRLRGCTLVTGEHNKMRALFQASQGAKEQKVRHADSAVRSRE